MKSVNEPLSLQAGRQSHSFEGRRARSLYSNAMKLVLFLCLLVASATRAQDAEYPGAGNIGYDTAEDYPSTVELFL